MYTKSLVTVEGFTFFPSNITTGSRVGAVVRALASHQCVPGSIPGPGVICGLSLLLVLYSAPRGFYPGSPVFPNISKFQIDLDVRHFSHEPLARVIAQALPVLDVKFHLHLHLHLHLQVVKLIYFL